MKRSAREQNQHQGHRKPTSEVTQIKTEKEKPTKGNKTPTPPCRAALAGPDFQWILLMILRSWPAVAVTCRGRVTPPPHQPPTQDLGYCWIQGQECSMSCE